MTVHALAAALSLASQVRCMLSLRTPPSQALAYTIAY